jgi:aspartate/methionine/tyrosine aminotransferase
MSARVATGTPRLPDLTQYELEALQGRHNMSDAHAHQRQSRAEQKVIDALPEIWDRSQVLTQAEIDDEFVRAFFGFQGQRTMVESPERALLCYAASVAMTIVATQLRMRRATVTLIEPCFDNLHDILVQNELRIEPLPEAVLFRSPDVYAALAAHGVADALVLVDPNNPTGETSFTDASSRFEEIVRFCADHGKTLVLDFSFASFLHSGARPGRPDVYEILERSSVSYMAIEDTGKTWPTQDVKCGILSASSDIWEQVRDLHTGVLLNVSPFALQVLTGFIEASVSEGFGSVLDVLAQNRRVLTDALRGTDLEIVVPTAAVSVAWLRLHRGTASELQARLARDGVHVLPGTHFFWSDHERGESYVRIALARDPVAFAASAEALRAALMRP